MHIGFYLFVAVFAGAITAFQPAWNAILARSIGSIFGAAAINTFIACAFCLLLLSFSGASRFSYANLTAVPWWVYLGGVAGGLFVAAGVVAAPVIGALVFFVCVVTGQLIGSTLADHFGAFGMDVRPVSFTRISGVALVLIGALLVGRG